MSTQAHQTALLLQALPFWIIAVAVGFWWRRWLGWTFLMGGVVAYNFVLGHISVERHVVETGRYTINDQSGLLALKSPSLQGSIFTSSSNLIDRLRGRSNAAVEIRLTGWYDFDRLVAYRIDQVDGVPFMGP